MSTETANDVPAETTPARGRGRPAGTTKPKPAKRQYAREFDALQGRVDTGVDLLEEALTMEGKAESNDTGWALVRIALKRLKGD